MPTRHSQHTDTRGGPGDTRSFIGSQASTNQGDAEGDVSAVVPGQIDRFLPRRCLGKGGFGTVYLAHDPTLDREIALKVPRLAASPPEQRQRFLQEARNAARLKHPHVVTVYDAGECAGQGLFIALEYVEGETLAERLRRGPLSVEETVRLCDQVASAVQAAHQLGIVHRDLKPSNILIDRAGQAKVCDFGLALHEEALARHQGEISGTWAYMSPEQARGDTHRLDGRSDIWSLGIILYECLTGKRPFRGHGFSEVRDEILHKDCKPLRQLNAAIPKGLDELCQKCLRREMEDRLRTAVDFQQALQSVGPTAKRPPRSKGWSLGLAGLAVAVVAAFAALLTGGKPWGKPPGEELLALAPRPVVFSQEATDAYQHFPGQLRLDIDSPHLSLFACGPHPRSIRLSVVALPREQPGAAGLVWGLHDAQDDNGRNWRTCLALLVEPREARDGNATVRVMMFNSVPSQVAQASTPLTSNLGDEPLRIDWSEPIEISAGIVDGKVRELLVQGQPVDMTKQFSKADVRQYATGECGVASIWQPVTFTQLVLEIER